MSSTGSILGDEMAKTNAKGDKKRVTEKKKPQRTLKEKRAAKKDNQKT
jgi:hypothetical protein